MAWFPETAGPVVDCPGALSVYSLCLPPPLSSPAPQVDEETQAEVSVDVAIWNPTVANLTLMALGSSAPEILLSVIETMNNLIAGEIPGELGPSTIVGSAAFNLLVISGVCVVAVRAAADSFCARVRVC